MIQLSSSSTTDTNLRPRISPVVAVALLTACIFACGAAYILLSDPFGTDPFIVVRRFADALIEGRRSDALALVSPELRDRVNLWLDSREPVHCPNNLFMDPDDDRVFMIGSPFTPTGINYFRHCHLIHYQFTLDEVELVRTGLIWRILDFRGPCESYDYSCP